MSDPLKDMSEAALAELVADVRSALPVSESDAVAIVRAAAPLWDVLEDAGGLVDSFGGSDFCTAFPQMLAVLASRQGAAESRSPLTFGAIINTLPVTTPASMAIRELSKEVEQAAMGLTTPLRLGVIFVLVSPRYGSPGFEGIGSHEFSDGDSLVVEAAVPDPGIGRVEIIELIAAAVEFAVNFARRKKIADDLPVLRTLLDVIRGTTTS
jgi:hypothetical protein